MTWCDSEKTVKAGMLTTLLLSLGVANVRRVIPKMLHTKTLHRQNTGKVTVVMDTVTIGFKNLSLLQQGTVYTKGFL